MGSSPAPPNFLFLENKDLDEMSFANLAFCDL